VRFVVAVRHRAKEIRKDPVEAPTAEHAIAKVANARERCLPGTVFEAWPKEQPTQVVKFTI